MITKPSLIAASLLSIGAFALASALAGCSAADVGDGQEPPQDRPDDQLPQSDEPAAPDDFIDSIIPDEPPDPEGTTYSEELPDEPGEPIGTVQEGLSGSGCVLTTYGGLNIFKKACSDGTSFRTKDGNTYNAYGTYTGLEWQCVEWARRYTWKKFGPRFPSVVGAKDMCANRPSGVTLVSYPKPGDLMVFTPGACGASSTYGHVAVVVGRPSSTKWRVKEQNGYQAAYHDYYRSCRKCYLHATNNTRTW